MYGAEIDKTVEISGRNAYSAALSADFSKEQSGVYIIVVSLNRESRAIPVVIAR